MERHAERTQKARRALVLGAPAAVCEVAAGDDQLGLDRSDQRGERALDGRVLLRARMDVGDVQDARRHDGIVLRRGAARVANGGQP